MVKTIGVIGGGTVGRAVARTWLEHCDDVLVWDQVKERRTTDDLDSVFHSDIVFFCLPEASLETFTDAVPRIYRQANIVLRSTVPIGTTRRLREKYGLTNLVHSPEFLTARCANTDAQVPARNIIGSPGLRGEYGRMTNACEMILKNLYEARFPGIPCLRMTSDESEAVKLFTNAFFAAKVSLFNEFRSLCDKLGMDWESVLAGILGDGRIAHSHTKVPGPDGKRGFGGACLPKDLRQLIGCYRDAGIGPVVLEAVNARNAIDRREPTCE